MFFTPIRGFNDKEYDFFEKGVYDSYMPAQLPSEETLLYDSFMKNTMDNVVYPVSILGNSQNLEIA
jgi:hypothetical protein